jgi:ABC-type multidrug transport system ATPase subunit
MVDGLDILEHPMEVKKKIGFLPEQPPLYLDMTVREYLNFIYDLRKCKLNRRAHIDEIIRVVKLEGTENRISVERQRYNEAVKEYNVSVRRFPNSIFASIFGFDKKPMFEAQAGAEVAPVVAF